MRNVRMTDQKPTVRAHLAKLRSNPRVAAFSLLGPTGEIFGLVEAIVGELEQLESQVAALDRYGKALKGVASCATQCGCCRMHAQIASETLGGKNGKAT